MEIANWKEIGILAVLTAVPFAFYFFNPVIFGTDTFLFLSNICHGSGLPDQDIGTIFVFSLLPCNFVFLKFLMFLLAFSCVLGVAQTGKLLYKNGWLAGVFVFLNPLLIFGMAQLENENFAMPLLFWANYFALKAVLEKSWKPKLKNMCIALGLVCIAAVFWKGAAYYVVGFGLLALPFALPALVSLFIYGQRMYDNLLPKPGMYEAEFGLGLIFMGFNVFTLIGAFLNKRIFLITFFWVGVLVFMAKFAINAVPWLAITTLAVYSEPRFLKLDGLLKIGFWKMVQTVFIGSCLILPFVYGYSITFFQPPQAEEIAITQEFVELQASGRVAKNDFSYGYWIQFWGGKPTSVGGSAVQDYNSGVILTPEDLNCSLLREFKQMKLWDCG